MTKPLSLLIMITDGGFMLYWAAAALALIGVISLPPEMMYGDYNDPRVQAWNWSFFPLDLAFSVFGFMALRAARRRDARWRSYALISLILTMTAGGMAVAYWTILLEFDPSWYGANLALMIWPLFFIRRLL